MRNKDPSPPQKRGFSRQLDDAMIETILTEAMVKADGWTLAHFVDAPHWLREIYNRHANAAYRELQRIETAENNLKPSEHD